MHLPPGVGRYLQTVTDEHFEAMRLRALDALARRSNGEIELAELVATLEGICGALDDSHVDIRAAISAILPDLEEAQFVDTRPTVVAACDQLAAELEEA